MRNVSARGIVIMLVATVAAACDGPTGSTTHIPQTVRVVAVTPTSLAGTVGTEVTPAPAVRAVDQNGSAVAGVTVSFDAHDGGTAANTTVTTDVNGLASIGTWTLGSAVGTQSVRARSTGHADVIFTAVVQAGPVNQLQAWRGNGQRAGVGQKLVQQLLVKVSDRFGNPVPNVAVAFTVVAGGGFIESNSVTSNAAGLAESGVWTLGPEAGLQRARAASGSTDVMFSAFAYASVGGLTGTLAFVTGDGGDTQVHTINADGTGLRSLTASTGTNHAPTWSPDGSRLAFVSDRDGARHIYIMNEDGSNVMRRSSGPMRMAGTDKLSWSPNGAAIAFTLHDNDTRIATISTTDTTVVVLTRSPGFNSQPAWSPDGRQLAFVSDRDAYDFVFNIYTMNADGTGQTLRTRGFAFWPAVAYYFHPTWSPDGSMIAFVYGTIINTSDMRFHVAVMSPTGLFLRDLAWAGDIPWMELLDPGSLTWAPDGSGLAFTFVDCDLSGATPGCSKVRSVHYVSVDGSRQGIIVSNAHSPAWRR